VSIVLTALRGFKGRRLTRVDTLERAEFDAIPERVQRVHRSLARLSRLLDSLVNNATLSEGRPMQMVRIALGPRCRSRCCAAVHSRSVREGK
jgi:BMFP domain-containing protein YqiC